MEMNFESTVPYPDNEQSELDRDSSMEDDEYIGLPIQTIFSQFGSLVLNDDSIVLSKEQKNALFCIARCKTGELGYNAERCTKCNKLIVHPRSCNNRSCPNCQYIEERQWVELRKAEVIERIPYYHVVVTIPSELYPLASANRSFFYTLLMKSAPDTLLELCRSDDYGAFTPGIISVLHSWSSRMEFHPHVHMILSGGGLTSDKEFKEAPVKNENKFFIPENVVAAKFRGKMIAGLQEAFSNPKIHLNLPSSPEGSLEDPQKWKNFCNDLYNTKWVAYLKETFNGNGNAIDYLGRYVYRTAISNSRIVSITVDDEHPEGLVSFKYKDYKDEGKTKIETISGKEFIIRFLNHVLPKGFCRVRYSGLLSNACKQKNLKLIAKIQKKIYVVSVLKGKKKPAVLQFFFGNVKNTCPCCGGELEYYGTLSKEFVETNTRSYEEAG